MSGLVATVSTVKDTLPNVQRFVSGNLACGVDTMVVVLDAPDAPGQADVRAWLEDHPRVLCIPADASWWAGDRPQQLNVRQRINANVVKHMLSGLDWVAWIFHIDGDEVVDLDRRVLDRLPADVPVVRLQPLEAVSRWHWDEPPTWFKRQLEEDDLTLLHTLGTIDKPSNSAYFHGHLRGKSGVRPAETGWLTLHSVVDEQRNDLPHYTHDALRVLHYESYSGEEFVRKWTAMVASGPKVSFRPTRGNTSVALGALLDKGLAPEAAEPYLKRIFERTTLDDFETLRDLGLLVRVDPRDGTHVPQPPPADGDVALADALAAVREVGKRGFHSASSAQKVTGPGRGASQRPAAASASATEGRFFRRKT